MIVATDAPLTPDQLKRLARRVSVGLGRVGAIEGDESGDIFLVFSTANAGADEGNSAEPPFTDPNATIQRMQSWKMDAMFTAVVQATEEAVINTIVAAKTMVGADIDHPGIAARSTARSVAQPRDAEALSSFRG